MVISETKGHIDGFSYNSEDGLKINAQFYCVNPHYYTEYKINFPYNQNVPEKLDLNSLRNAKIKVTVEVVDK